MCTLFAQKGEIYYGLQGGPSFDWMSSDNNLINSNGVRFGFKLGGALEYYLDDWLIFSTGVGFAFGQGGKLLYKTGGDLFPNSDIDNSELNPGNKPFPNNTEVTYKMQIFEFPTSLKYLISLPNQNVDFFFAFPEITLGIIGRTRGDISATGLELSRQDIGKDVRAFNMSWGVGTGVTYEAQVGRVSAGIYLQRGISDLTKDDGTLVTENPDGTFETERENSRGTLNGIILKLAYFF